LDNVVFSNSKFFVNLGLIVKMYIQEHIQSHTQKSHFRPPKILFRTSRGSGTRGWESLLYRV